METIKVNMNPNPLDVQTIHASQNDTEARQWEFELHNNGELIDTSGITEQMVFKSYKGGTEQILPENGAVPVTAPFVGDIQYPDATRTGQEFLYRQSPAEKDGLAWIKSIKGNTVKFNQLCDDNFGKSLVDFTLSNHELTFDFTSTTNINWWNYQIYSQLEYDIQANHKYFIRFWVKSNYPMGNIVFNGDKSISAGETVGGYSKRYSLFTNATANKGRFYLRPLSAVTANTHYQNIKIKNIQIFDLTAMGIDSFTTVEQVETWLSNNIGLLPYYDYCQGAMLSFGGRNVKFNQLIENGNFASTTGWGGNNSSITVANNVLTGTTTTSHATAGLRKMDNVSFVANHKYLISAVMSCSVASDYCVARFYATGYDFRTDALTISANTKKRQVWILTPTSAFSGSLYIYPKYSYPEPLAVGDTFTFENVMLIDLTEMFGAGNEPSAEGFKELFPNEYYDYTTSQYMNIGQPVSLKAVGFNQWDEEWEHGSLGNNGENTGSSASPEIRSKNYIPIVQNASYYLNVPAVAVVHYYGSADLSDYKGNQHIASAQLLNIPNGTKYIRFRTIGSYGDYKNDICLNISDPSRNGQYEPYTESTLSIPLDEFPDGMDGINDARDYKNETGYAKKIGRVDLGSLNWTNDIANRFYSTGIARVIKIPNNPSEYADGLTCAIYTSSTSPINEKTQMQTIAKFTNGNIYVLDDRYSNDATAFKTAMNGVYLYYELATPLENYGVVDLGTLNWTYSPTTGHLYFNSADINTLVKKASASGVYANIVCQKYNVINENEAYNNTKVGIGIMTSGAVRVYDPTYNNVEDFKSAMQGVYLLYEKKNPQGFTTATLVTENGEVALANENGVLVGKCNSNISAGAGFIEGKIKLSDEDGDVYSSKIQIHVERSPQ